jgi:ketosteroid isomerase-like protein
MRCVPIPEPDEFSAHWLRAFNEHDLEGVLERFADDVVFTSPVAARVVPESGGLIRGKDALRAYWESALLRAPDLHFDVVGVYAGVDTVVINYRNHAGGLVNEVLTFDDRGLVISGHGTYLQAVGAPQTGSG